MKLNRLSLTAMAVAAGLFAGRAIADDHAAPHWSYEGHGNPAEWGQLSNSYEACGVGKDQSPIDLRDARPAQLAPIEIHYHPLPLAIVNNGHTIQVNLPPGNYITFEGERYDLLQYHFHTPSEHTFNGKPAPLELHLVHKGAQSGKLTVLGVALVAGEANPVVQAVWNIAPTAAGPVKEAPLTLVDPTALLPAQRAYYRYEGSLTTPPCTEIVHWVVFKQPVTISLPQIDTFAKLFPHNARPVQPINRRFILESQPSH
ncbi:carbonic anhydrase [Magnetospirillum fulvum]|uniref:carbonic anhydrase n=1 Tax=Magnetospirillum fulvum TaxID=1082 RepID=A0A1H6HEB9_MAGFU|nr:carbonic anhydrase family protein [Magnetospirillum fulvum]SEH34149.1 carbonic anhydrase [Magnetospirillum fulvum]